MARHETDRGWMLFLQYFCYWFGMTLGNLAAASLAGDLEKLADRMYFQGVAVFSCGLMDYLFRRN